MNQEEQLKQQSIQTPVPEPVQPIQPTQSIQPTQPTQQVVVQQPVQQTVILPTSQPVQQPVQQPVPTATPAPKSLVITASLDEVPPPTPAPIHPAIPMEEKEPELKPIPIVAAPPKKLNRLVKGSLVIATLSLIISIGLGTYTILELKRLDTVITNSKQQEIDKKAQEEKELEEFKALVKQSSPCSYATCPEDCEEEYCDCLYYDDNYEEHTITCQRDLLSE
jgi:hypothetical protein